MIESSHPLYHAWLKIDRAKVHLRSLKGSITKFKKNPRPTQSIIKKNGKEHTEFMWPPLPPDSWGLILSDFANNLRASLDFITWELATKNLSGSNTPRSGVSFPIFDDPTMYKRESNRKVRDVLPATIPIIEGMQPYNRGNCLIRRSIDLLSRPPVKPNSSPLKVVVLQSSICHSIHQRQL